MPLWNNKDMQRRYYQRCVLQASDFFPHLTRVINHTVLPSRENQDHEGKALHASKQGLTPFALVQLPSSKYLKWQHSI